MKWQTLYPETRWVSRDWIIGQAKDHLATEYMRQNPHADESAIEENARITDVYEAVGILEDAGLVTFGANTEGELP